MGEPQGTVYDTWDKLIPVVRRIKNSVVRSNREKAEVIDALMSLDFEWLYDEVVHFIRRHYADRNTVKPRCT